MGRIPIGLLAITITIVVDVARRSLATVLDDEDEEG